MQEAEVWRDLSRGVLSIFPGLECRKLPATHLSSWPAAVWLLLGDGWGTPLSACG